MSAASLQLAILRTVHALRARRDYKITSRWIKYIYFLYFRVINFLNIGLALFSYKYFGTLCFVFFVFSFGICNFVKF